MLNRLQRLFCASVPLSWVVAMVMVTSASCNDASNDSGWPLPHFEAGCRSLMHGLHQEWLEADGEVTFVVAQKMFWALMLSPNLFYEEFSSDTTSYNRFTERLDKLVFWNPSDTTTAHLENLRLVAIDRLVELTYSVNDNYRDSHEELIDIIRAITVTHVD